MMQATPVMQVTPSYDIAHFCRFSLKTDPERSIYSGKQSKENPPIGVMCCTMIT